MVEVLQLGIRQGVFAEDIDVTATAQVLQEMELSGALLGRRGELDPESVRRQQGAAARLMRRGLLVDGSDRSERSGHQRGEETGMAVHFEGRRRVAVVTIDRPDVANAIDRPTADELVAAFERFDTDDAFHVAVLTGANGTFCAGADLKAMREPGMPRASRVAPDGDGPVGPTRRLLSKPVVAAIEGHAVAGGLELAAWCDLRVAADDAVFGVFCRRWGIPLMDGGTIRLARLIGLSHALDLILTGRGVSGDEAWAMGLANRLVLPGSALAAALQLAEEIAEWPPAAQRSDRLSAYEQWSLALEDALANEYGHGRATLTQAKSVQKRTFSRRFCTDLGGDQPRAR